MKKKIIIISIIVAIAVFAASLGITYAVITVSHTSTATPDEAATVDSAVSATEPPTKTPTEAPTDPPTEPPTEPPYLDAYRAFRKVLRDNESDIRAYTWQYKTDTPQPIAFADIMGDDTPEMVYAYSHNGNTNAKVFSYNGSNAVEVLDYMFPDNNKNMPGQMFLSQIDGTLYIFELSAPGVARFETAFRCDEGSNNSLHPVEDVRYNPRTDLQNTEYGQSRINGSVVSPAKAKEAYQTLAESTDALLMSSSDTQGKSYPRSLGLDAEHYPNHSMTFDKAIAFLNDIIEDK